MQVFGDDAGPAGAAMHRAAPGRKRSPTPHVGAKAQALQGLAISKGEACTTATLPPLSTQSALAIFFLSTAACASMLRALGCAKRP